MRDEQRRQHVGKHTGGGDDEQDHHAFLGAVAQDDPQITRVPQFVDDHRDDQTHQCANRRGFGRCRDTAIHRIENADDDQQERQNARQDFEPLGPCVATRSQLCRIARLPCGIQRPRHEQTHQQQAGDDACQKQTANRGFCGDSVDDHRHRRRDQNAQRAARSDGARGHAIGIPALAHFRDAHFANRRAGCGGRSRHRGKQGAGAKVGHDQTTGNAGQPAF